MLEKHPFGYKSSSWRFLGHLWCIPFNYLGVVDNDNKEKTIVNNKITPITTVLKTTKIPLLKLFLDFRDNIY